LVLQYNFCSYPAFGGFNLQDFIMNIDDTKNSAGQNDSNSLCGVFKEYSAGIKQALIEQSYTKPTPIQEQCMHPISEGKDVIGIAQTGTGKTAAFSLPLLERMIANDKQFKTRNPKVLILAPTRELASQIGESIEKYGKNLPFRHTVIFGGVGQKPQVNALRRGVNILIATPGRLIDLMDQGYVHLEDLACFILDEVDRMLDMGFIHAIRRILKVVPQDRQTLFFSATMPPSMEKLALSMVRKNPVRVAIAPKEPTVDRINQTLFHVPKNNKINLLLKLLENSDLEKVVVFTQMKHMANRVAKKLQGNGFPCAAIHGNKSQSARTKALQDFKTGSSRALIATDVAARGLDINKVTHVINFDLPIEAETYVHRIGRTARAGADGEAISFCGRDEVDQLKSIEKLLRKPIPEKETPELPKVESQNRDDEFSNRRRPPQRRFSRKPNSNNPSVSKRSPRNHSRNRQS
jgi:ATP-dependent RNA helicase RhlE